MKVFKLLLGFFYSVIIVKKSTVCAASNFNFSEKTEKQRQQQ